ncbi:MAG: hypothetical protein IJP66_05110 [Kiritimatiellae bacterium]|nr:hypothetical protein [Kiritimatiellia bacterium]
MKNLLTIQADFGEILLHQNRIEISFPGHVEEFDEKRESPARRVTALAGAALA